jgi:hypothetical protein
VFLAGVDFKKGFGSSRRFEWVKTPIKLVIASIHSVIRSISALTFRDPYLDPQ